MAALSARDTFRYGMRLFGYLLVTTVLGGGLVAGGAVLSTRVAIVETISGTADGSYAVVAAALGLSLLGVLVLATGWLLVAFVAVTDAVRLGIDHSAFGPAPREPTPEVSAEDTDETASDQPSEQQGDSEADDPLGDGAEPFAESADPFAEPETNDPLGRSEGDREPTGGRQQATDRRQAGPTRAEDDEAWRREIEAKLDDDGRQPREK